MDPVATGSIFPSAIGRVNAVSVISPLTSLMSTPKVQSPLSGGVNQIDSGFGTLLPAVIENVIESRNVLLTKASNVTSIISKNASEVICKSIWTLSSRLFSSLSKVVTSIMSTSAGLVISPAWTTMSVVG